MEANGGAAAEKVVVAVRAEKVISRTALAWALTHVVRPGDCVALLAVFPGEKRGKRFWNFPGFTGNNCAGGFEEDLPDRIFQISESCSQMVLQFHNQIEVRVRIKVVVSAATGSSVTDEAKKHGASWVILDKKLKQELRHCLDELRCNIVVMKGSTAKVLRLNLQCSEDFQSPCLSSGSSLDAAEFTGQGMKHSTPVSSPEKPQTSYSRIVSDEKESHFQVYNQNPLFERLSKGNYKQLDYKKLIPLGEKPRRRNSLLNRFVQYDHEKVTHKHSNQKDYIVSVSGKNPVSLGRTSSKPPPLCSLCQHKTPVFGKPPKQFSYEELVEATDGFSDVNFLAEGGFGIVYRGVLRDGQVVAVKLLKFCGSQADADFCREVRVLSCAQHRNVVLLIGFCVEDKKRVLVYEYICNGSLDFHLHGNERAPLDWNSRLRIAIGTARGLRYLHEDCRVGCIVHRDMRPNNILLTHDFEPLVTDFGLARWHFEWNCNEERLIGTTGYLAPEYLNGGIITPKVDVYAFGVVLIELMIGRKISELQMYNGRSFFSHWLYDPVAALEPSHLLNTIHQFLDPFLASGRVVDYSHQLEAMCRAASQCLIPDPDARPSMSKVLRILEGGDMAACLGLDLSSVGNRSARLPGLSSRMSLEARRRHSRKLSH